MGGKLSVDFRQTLHHMKTRDFALGDHQTWRILFLTDVTIADAAMYAPAPAIRQIRRA